MSVEIRPAQQLRDEFSVTVDLELPIRVASVEGENHVARVRGQGGGRLSVAVLVADENVNRWRVEIEHPATARCRLEHDCGGLIWPWAVGGKLYGQVLTDAVGRHRGRNRLGPAASLLCVERVHGRLLNLMPGHGAGVG